VEASCRSQLLPSGRLRYRDLVIEEGDLRQLLTVLMSAIPDDVQLTYFDKLRKSAAPILDWLLSIGGIERARRDAQYNHDLSNEFFKLFLDRNMHIPTLISKKVMKRWTKPKLQKSGTLLLSYRWAQVRRY
jgi:hypothetical protein